MCVYVCVCVCVCVCVVGALYRTRRRAKRLSTTITSQHQPLRLRNVNQCNRAAHNTSPAASMLHIAPQDQVGQQVHHGCTCEEDCVRRTCKPNPYVADLSRCTLLALGPASCRTRVAPGLGRPCRGICGAADVPRTDPAVRVELPSSIPELLANQKHAATSCW
jgi:hypothetical protein